MIGVLTMYLHRYPLIALINTTVLLLINGCGMFCNNPRPDSFSNNLDEQCKQIIKVINRSSIPINKPVPLPEFPSLKLPELPSLKLPELPSDNKDSDNSLSPKRFNSRKKTGKTDRELQQEAYEKKQEAYEKKNKRHKRHTKKRGNLENNNYKSSQNNFN